MPGHPESHEESWQIYNELQDVDAMSVIERHVVEWEVR